MLAKINLLNSKFSNFQPSSSVNGIGTFNSGHLNSPGLSSLFLSVIPAGVSVVDLNKPIAYEDTEASLKKHLKLKRFLKTLFELTFAFVGYKLAPILKSKVAETKILGKEAKRQTNLKEKFSSSKIEELNEESETFFGLKVDLKNPLDVIKQFVGLDLNNSVIGLIGGFGFGKLLFKILSQLTNQDEPNTSAEIKGKSNDNGQIKRNFFDSLIELSIKLVSSLTVAHWVHSKIKNPLAEFAGLLFGYFIGEAINLFDEFLKNLIYKKLEPPLEKLTGAKLEEKLDTSAKWNTAASLARSISLAVLIFLKYLILLPKKKLLFYQAQYEPLKKTKNDFIVSANNHLKLQVIPSSKISGANFDPEAIPSQNIEYTYEWLDSIHQGVKAEHSEMNSGASVLVNTYLSHLKMMMNTVRSPKFTDVAANKASSNKEKVLALIQDSGRNIAFKLPLSLLIVVYATFLDFIFYVLNPLREKLLSLFGVQSNSSVDSKDGKK